MINTKLDKKQSSVTGLSERFCRQSVPYICKRVNITGGFSIYSCWFCPFLNYCSCLLIENVEAVITGYPLFKYKLIVFYSKFRRNTSSCVSIANVKAMLVIVFP